MNNIKGFSLVELMVAVGIVGVMSSVAVPKYQKYKVDAARSEARSNMSSIYTLQQLHYTDKDFYGAYDGGAANTNQIAFPTNVAAKYDYVAIADDEVAVVGEITHGTDTDTNGLPTVTAGSAGMIYFKGLAVSKQVLGSCAKKTGTTPNRDAWCVDFNKEIKNDGKVSASTACAADDDSKFGGCEG